MRKALILLAVLVQVICLAGCSDSTGKLEGYIKDRYGIDVEYDDYHVGTIYRFRDADGELKQDIHVSYNKKGDKEYFADNVMAVKYYDQAYDKIDDAVSQSVNNHELYMDISDSVFIVEDVEGYSLSDYLYDENAYKGLHIYVEYLDEMVYSNIINSLRLNNISAQGAVVQVKNLGDVEGLSPSMEESFITNWDNIEKQINFTLLSGELIYSDWIDLGHGKDEGIKLNEEVTNLVIDEEGQESSEEHDEYFGMYWDDYDDVDKDETIDWDKHLQELLEP